MYTFQFSYNTVYFPGKFQQAAEQTGLFSFLDQGESWTDAAWTTEEGNKQRLS